MEENDFIANHILVESFAIIWLLALKVEQDIWIGLCVAEGFILLYVLILQWDTSFLFLNAFLVR